MVLSAMPRARKPDGVNAICSAVSGGGWRRSAVKTGADAIHARAAAPSRMRSSQKRASTSLR